MYVLLAIDAVLVIAGFINGGENALADGSVVDIVLNWTIGLGAVAVILALASAVFDVAQDPKQLVKGGIGLVAVVVLLAIFWAIADDTPLQLIGYEGEQNHGNWLKIADTGLFTVYLAIGLGVLSIVVSEIYQLFR